MLKASLPVVTLTQLGWPDFSCAILGHQSTCIFTSQFKSNAIRNANCKECLNEILLDDFILELSFFTFLCAFNSTETKLKFIIGLNWPNNYIAHTKDQNWFKLFNTETYKVKLTDLGLFMTWAIYNIVTYLQCTN